MPMPGRTYSSTSYRYGFNGKENDNDVKGTGNQQDYGMRINDPRLGRFLSIDPITADYPWLTPYQFASNRPIDGIDRDGLEWAEYARPYAVIRDNKSKMTFEQAQEYERNGRRAGMTYMYATFLLPLDAATGFNGHRIFGTLLTIFSASNLYEYTNRNGNQKDPNIKAENSEKARGALADLALNFAMAKVAGATFNSIRAIALKRINLANNFYKSAGYTDDAARSSHLNGIAFEESVETVVLKKGTKINQWVNSKKGVGDYFTNAENTGQNLGIDDYDKRTLKQFILTEDVKVLKSTAAEYSGAKGGGKQYFSPEIKKSVAEVGEIK